MGTCEPRAPAVGLPIKGDAPARSQRLALSLRTKRSSAERTRTRRTRAAAWRQKQRRAELPPHARDVGGRRLRGRRSVSGGGHAQRTVTVRVSERMLAIELDDEPGIVRRTTTLPVRTIKAERPMRRAPRADQPALSASAELATEHPQ
jgi:hypothetical protein